MEEGSLPDHHFMNLALQLALKAKALDEVPIGAVLVRGEEILGEGFNCREIKQRTFSHAEIEALEVYNQKFKSWRLPEGTSLFVTAEPCLMCASALFWARVENIYYGCQDPRNAGIERIRNLIEEGIFDHRPEKIEGGILGERCGLLLKEYFMSKRSV